MPGNPIMKMDLMIQQLLGVIEEESEIYRAMLTLIDKESKAAVRSDVIALTTAGEEKENILAKLALIEDHRMRVVNEMADALGYPPGDLTISKISQLMGEPFAGRLSQAGAELLTVLNTVKAANRRNKLLFEHSRELLRGSFNILSELTRSDTVYYRTGNIQRTYQTGKCVNGEI
jgi:flagellar biosynthesis/type III secretory pathway chaperone